MKRNRGERGYRPKQAHEFSQARMRACENGPRVTVETWAMVDAKLGETWSPEQVCGYLKVNGQSTVSHESIYQRIYADKRAGGTLHRTLRCQKTRRKRYGDRERRGTIPTTRSPSICALPSWPSVAASVTGRRTGIGAGQKQALVTINERTPLLPDRACAIQDRASRFGHHDLLADAFRSQCSHTDDRQRQGVCPA